MCSVNDDGCSEAFEDLEKNEPLDVKCRKCQIQNGNVVLRKKDVYCKDCFLTMVVHKFRATLGKSKLVRQNERVLICVSGSLCSVSLLHMVWSGLQQSTHKRLTFKPIVLHIDESVLFNYPEERYIGIKEVFDFYSLPYHIVPLSLALYSKNALEENNNLSEYDKKLKSLVNSIADLTLKQDILVKLRKHAIMKLAADLNCTRVMTAENEHMLSIRLLSNVALGRGSQIGLDIGLAVNDKKNNNTSIVILRPLRELSAKEISYYVLFNTLQDFVHFNFLTATNEDESIQKTTEQFINNLQVEFPSTVSTIFRTGEKIVEKALDNYTCSMCNGVMDVDMPSSSAIQATKYSKYVSQMGIRAVELSFRDNLKVEQQVGNNCDECNCANNREQCSKQELRDSMCYGCRNIIQNLDSMENLPQEILEKCKENTNVKNMEEQIKDFIL
ncbi:cytoplasmic tRNA 2-thiolation protein 2-A [Adelges cooleyi]|uniref:cytoplasmic tRNA 2-thiolation protein 2-A n=1 Tax=Adelges cooleyi TaxID=133065 RepID=UPI00217F7893|nr:cytoplasmic tRNA 2-thiolation protein 2-A [Adelges cooleyi]